MPTNSHVPQSPMKQWWFRSILYWVMWILEGEIKGAWCGRIYDLTFLAPGFLAVVLIRVNRMKGQLELYLVHDW